MNGIKSNVRAILKLNRRIIALTTVGCILGLILCVSMLFWMSSDSPAEVEQLIFGKIAFVILALLLIAATVYCYSRLYITLYFTDKGIRYCRAFSRTRYHSYDYYSYVFLASNSRHGRTIKNNKKTYYLILTRNIYCDYDLCHAGRIYNKHHTIKLFYSDELYSLLMRVLPQENQKYLIDALNKEEEKRIYF